MARKTIQPKTLNDPRPRYTQGILNQGGKLLFIAGQTASDKDGNVVGKDNIKAQTEQVFANLKAVLKAAGGTIDDLVMTTTYIVDENIAKVTTKCAAASTKRIRRPAPS